LFIINESRLEGGE
jgi:hypothetical protein